MNEKLFDTTQVARLLIPKSIDIIKSLLVFISFLVSSIYVNEIVYVNHLNDGMILICLISFF